MMIFTTLCQPVFQPPPLSLHLTSNEIHVWSVELSANPQQQNELFTLLSANEKARANRFRFPTHQKRFTIARASLRKILALYRHCNPTQLQFAYNQHGKPFLPDQNEEATASLQFNVSHSENLAIYAIALQSPIGIDVEYIRTNVATDKLAARFFTKHESQALRDIPEPERLLGFFYLWTRKEAFLKALGEGLAFPLNQFEVSLDPQATYPILSIQTDQQKASRWALHSFLPAPGFIAAIAMEKIIQNVQYWQFDPCHGISSHE